MRPLADARVVIVDADLLPAVHLAGRLADAGATVVGVFAREDMATLAAGMSDCNVALIDPCLGDGSGLPAALRFIGRGIPVVVTSAAAQAGIPEPLRRRCYIAKPFRSTAVIEAIAGVLRGDPEAACSAPRPADLSRSRH